MGLNDTPNGERVHIAFFGRRNAGKSSLVNAVTAQNISVVSNVPGTTTDPVSKAMELLPLGPVLITDTPGFDDEGALGELRVKTTRRVLDRADIAVLVVEDKIEEAEQQLINEFSSKKLNYITVYTKADVHDYSEKKAAEDKSRSAFVSAVTGEGITELKEMLSRLMPEKKEARIIGDKLVRGDVVVLVTPIDESAPKGRMILPQVQTIRDVLDSGAMPIVCKETELTETMAALANPPKLVITDSSVFDKVNSMLPASVPLTSFSLLFARYKGFLGTALKGVDALNTLKDGDTVLISEGCTHHRQCNDIGTTKIPKVLKKITGKELNLTFSSGGEFPEDLSGISMVVHCGGCMLNDAEMRSRAQKAEEQKVPFTNYGILFAHAAGILERSTECFRE